MDQKEPTQSKVSDRRGFEYKSHGINNQGNHYCARDYDPSAPNQNAYHYSNTDGEYYHNNADGSKYYNNGGGKARYTAPDGSVRVREQKWRQVVV